MITEDKIYAAIIQELESLENEGVYKGNGHHLAQRLSKLAAINLLPPKERAIYDAMKSFSWQSAKQIAETMGCPTETVSAQLRYMLTKSTLIQSKEDGNKMLWKKTKIY